MYTFNRVIKDEKDVSKRRRVVLVEFINDRDETLERDMQFSINETDQAIKRAFKQFLDEINTPTSPITDLTVADEPAPEEPDAREVAFTEWNNDLQRLLAVKSAVALGLELATPTQVTQLTNKVQTGMVKTDERYIQALASVNRGI